MPLIFLLTPPSFFFGIVSVKSRHAPHRLFPPPPSYSLFWFVLNLENCKRSISLTWKRLFCWGWVTDTIRWIWKWCVDATPEGKSRQIYLWSSFNKKIIMGGGGSRKWKLHLLKLQCTLVTQLAVWHAVIHFFKRSFWLKKTRQETSHTLYFILATLLFMPLTDK